MAKIIDLPKCPAAFCELDEDIEELQTKVDEIYYHANELYQLIDEIYDEGEDSEKNSECISELMHCLDIFLFKYKGEIVVLDGGEKRLEKALELRRLESSKRE